MADSFRLDEMFPNLPANCSRRRERSLNLESLEPRLAMATGPLSTLLSIVDGSGASLLGAQSVGQAASVAEGAAIAASVKLTRQPSAPVRVSLTSGDRTEVGLGENSGRGGAGGNAGLLFTPANWNLPQTLPIRGIEDGVADGTRLLPLRLSISTSGQASLSRQIWIKTIDSGRTDPVIPTAGIYRGVIEGPGSSGTVSGSYGGGIQAGMVTFRVSSPLLTNVRDRVITIGYAIDSANHVIVRSVAGFDPAGVKLDLTYRVGSDGVPTLSGTLLLSQPNLGKQATLRVTAGLITPGMSLLDGYAVPSGTSVAVGGAPSGLVVDADGSAWLANPGLNSVQRLLRRQGVWTVADTVAVGNGASEVSVAADGTVWVANTTDGTIQPIARNNAGVWTAGAPIAVAANPSAIVVARDNAVWVASGSGKTVQRIATVNGAPVVTVTLAVGTGPKVLAASVDNAIWVANTTGNTVRRISFEDGAWRVGAPTSVVRGPSSLAASADGSLWVASATARSLQRVTFVRGLWRAQAAVATAGVPADITTHPDGSLWVAAGDSIQRFVPALNKWRSQSSITVGGVASAIRSAPDGSLLVVDAQAAIVKAVSRLPAEVRNLAVAPTGVGALRLSWNAPVTGRSASYTVTMTATNGSTATSQTMVTSNTSVDYSGLSPSNSYSFSVAASDIRGSGQVVTASFGAVGNVPTQPLNLVATINQGSGLAGLTWQAPVDDGGSPIVSYTVTAYQGLARQTLTTTSLSCAFSDLASGNAPLLFRVRATTFAGNGLPASLAVAADGTPLPLPPGNPFMGLDGTSTMHANASSSDATVFSGPGTSQLEFKKNFNMNATMPSVLMSENGGLVCVGVGTTASTAQTPIVMLVSPKTLDVLDQVKLIKPQTGNLAGGLYNYLDHQNRLVLVNGEGVMQWYSNNYDRATDTGSLTLEQSVNIGQPMVVGLVPDYVGRIWFATQGSLSTSEQPAVVGYYDPQSGAIQTFNLPAGEMVANSISSSPAGVAVATTTALYLFSAGQSGTIQEAWRQVYQNSGVRKPGQLSPGTGSTPVFFGPTTGYDYIVITDNATAPGTSNATPAENVNVYSVANGNLVAQTPFLTSSNAGTENAPIAVGNRIFVPSTYGYWYPPPSETPSNSVPSIQQAPFVGGFQGMTLASNGASLVTDWGPANTVPSSALPRLSLADNLIYTVLANSSTQGSGLSTQTTVSYSFAAINADTGQIVGTPLALGSNTFSGDYPNYLNTGNYSWNTLQMTGVISPDGVFYQGTAAGIVMVSRQRTP